MEELLRGAADRAVRRMRDPAAVPEPQPVPPVDLPDKPVPDDDLLDLLARATRPGTGAARPAALAAHWLAAGTAPVPESLVPWLVELLDLPAGTAGAVVRDAPTATVAALAAARYRVLADLGWDVESRGLTGAPPLTVVVGEEAHVTLYRALRLLGLGRDRVIRIRADGQGRMRPALIPPLRPPSIVCAQVGEAASGAVDPVAAICAEVHDADAWVHVDGGFGMWAAAGALTGDLLVGVPYADSWAVDAAVPLGVPFDSGLVLARDADALRVALEVTGPAGGIEVWAALLALGRAGVAELVGSACDRARWLARELTAAGYPVLNEVVLDRLVVGLGDAGRVADAAARLRAAGSASVTGTGWRGRHALCLRTGTGPATDEALRRTVDAVTGAVSSRA